MPELESNSTRYTRFLDDDDLARDPSYEAWIGVLERREDFLKLGEKRRSRILNFLKSPDLIQELQTFFESNRDIAGDVRKQLLEVWLRKKILLPGFLHVLVVDHFLSPQFQEEILQKERPQE